MAFVAEMLALSCCSCRDRFLEGHAEEGLEVLGRVIASRFQSSSVWFCGEVRQSYRKAMEACRP